VTDAFEINADGSEGAVVVEKVETMNAIGELNDCLAFTRQELVTGWYHSHPFDVGSVPNWFLSDTDVRSQRMWQEMEDKYAPFLSLVVDPLTGLSKGRPEIGAFRTLPPAYTPPHGMGPDGARRRSGAPSHSRRPTGAPHSPLLLALLYPSRQATSGRTRRRWTSAGAPPTSPTTASASPTSPTPLPARS
jgi:hypothetical protein